MLKIDTLRKFKLDIPLLGNNSCGKFYTWGNSSAFVICQALKSTQSNFQETCHVYG